MEQVPVSGMDLDAIQAKQRSTPRRLHEVLAHPRHAVVIESRGCIVSRMERQRRRCDSLPSSRLVRGDLRAALPRQPRRGLASGMRQLQYHADRRVGSDRREYTRQRRGILVAVQPQIARRDAAVRRHRSSLDGQHRGAGERQMAQMDHVPIGRRTVHGGVLTHGRDEDAVRQRQFAQVEGRE